MKKYAIALYIVKNSESEITNKLQLLFLIADSLETAVTQAFAEYKQAGYLLKYYVGFPVPEEYLNAKLENRPQIGTELFCSTYGETDNI